MTERFKLIASVSLIVMSEKTIEVRQNWLQNPVTWLCVGLTLAFSIAGMPLPAFVAIALVIPANVTVGLGKWYRNS